MNLYAIKFTHYAPKDGKEGIATYLLAENDERVYEWLKSEPQVDEHGLWNSYKYNEEDGKTYDIYDKNYNIIGEEAFKDYMIRIGGEMYDEYADVDDAYYGVTHYGWKLVKEGIDSFREKVLIDLGIAIKP